MVKRYIETGRQGKFLKDFFNITDSWMPDIYKAIEMVFKRSEGKVFTNVLVRGNMPTLIYFVIAQKAGLEGRWQGIL